MSNGNEGVETPDEEVQVDCPQCGLVIDDIDGAVVARTGGLGSWRSRHDEAPHHDWCASYCEWCSEHYSSDHVDTYDTGSCTTTDICQQCRNDYGYTCERCNVIVHSDSIAYDEDSDSYYCYDCYSIVADASSLLHDHSYRPQLVYWHKASDGSLSGRARPFTTKTLYMGFELETNSNGDRRGEAARYIYDNSDENYLILKRDGSVSGFEMVSMPATLAAHKEMAPWQAIENLRNYDMTSWRGAGCGLHVHVSRSAFGKDDIYKLLTFHQQNAEMIQRFGGRHSDQWATFHVRYGSDEPSKLLMAKGHSNYHRYVAVNLQNRHTIELRYFRGSLKATTVIGVLEFVHTLHEYITSINAVDVFNHGALAWGAYIEWLERRDNGDLDHLIPLLDRRGVLNATTTASHRTINDNNGDDSPF